MRDMYVCPSAQCKIEYSKYNQLLVASINLAIFPTFPSAEQKFMNAMFIPKMSSTLGVPILPPHR